MESLRNKAKRLGIKSYWNKKPENIKKEIEALNLPELDIDTSEDSKNILDRYIFNFGALKQHASQLGADRIVFRFRSNAFECYKEEQSIEFLAISMF